MEVPLWVRVDRLPAGVMAVAVLLTRVETLNCCGVVVKLTAKAYVYDARHEKAFASDVMELVFEQMQREGILMPWCGSAQAGPRGSVAMFTK